MNTLTKLNKFEKSVLIAIALAVILAIIFIIFSFNNNETSNNTQANKTTTVKKENQNLLNKELNIKETEKEDGNYLNKTYKGKEETEEYTITKVEPIRDNYTVKTEDGLTYKVDNGDDNLEYYQKVMVKSPNKLDIKKAVRTLRKVFNDPNLQINNIKIDDKSYLFIDSSKITSNDLRITDKSLILDLVTPRWVCVNEKTMQEYSSISGSVCSMEYYKLSDNPGKPKE